MTFKTTRKINKWVKEHSEQCSKKSFDGAQYEYTFIPTAIVSCQQVKCLICGKDCTDYYE